MANKAWLLALGTGYICTKIKEIKKISIEADLFIEDQKQKRTNILLVVTDKEICKDVMAITICKNTNTINIITFDDRSYINEINIYNSYDSKKPENTMILLNKNLKTSIDSYIHLDYELVKYTVDMLGGLGLTIPNVDLDLVNGLREKRNPEKYYKLNGDEAICYMNSEGKGKTTDKIYRQKKIIKMLSNELFKLKTNRFIHVLKTIVSKTESNLAANELIALGMTLLKIGSSNIRNQDYQNKDKQLA